MYSIYDWPLDRSLGTDSSSLAPALSLDSALRDAWTLPCHSEMLLGGGEGQGEDAGLPIAVLKIPGCGVLPRDLISPATDV